MYSRCLTIFFLLLFSGCSRTIEFTLPVEQSFELLVYSGSSPVQQCKLLPGDEKVSYINNWLSKNSKNWEPSLATYAPSVLILGEDISINFLHTSVILNYPGGQFTHEIALEDYEKLSCL